MRIFEPIIKWVFRQVYSPKCIHSTTNVIIWWTLFIELWKIQFSAFSFSILPNNGINGTFFLPQLNQSHFYSTMHTVLTMGISFYMFCSPLNVSRSLNTAAPSHMTEFTDRMIFLVSGKIKLNYILLCSHSHSHGIKFGDHKADQDNHGIISVCSPSVRINHGAIIWAGWHGNAIRFVIRTWFKWATDFRPFQWSQEGKNYEIQIFPRNSHNFFDGMYHNRNSLFAHNVVY